MECLLITKSNGDLFDLITESGEHFYRNDGRLGTSLRDPWDLYDNIFDIKNDLRRIRIFGRAGWGAIYIGDVSEEKLDKFRCRLIENDSKWADMARSEPGEILQTWLSKKPRLVAKYSLA